MQIGALHWDSPAVCELARHCQSSCLQPRTAQAKRPYPGPDSVLASLPLSSIVYPALINTVLTELCPLANFAVTQAICEVLVLRQGSCNGS